MLQNFKDWFFQVDSLVIVLILLFLLGVIIFFVMHNKLAHQRTELALLVDDVEDTKQDLQALQLQLQAAEVQLQTLDQHNDELEVSLERRQTTLDLKEDELWRSQAQSAQLSQQLEQLRTQISQLQADKLTLEISTATEKQHLQELKTHFDTARAQLATEFEHLADKIMSEKTQSLSRSSDEQIKRLMDPFRDNLKSFEGRVNAVHEQSIRDHSALQTQVKQVMEMGVQMSQEADNLARALKGDKQVLGSWGEMQLEMVLQKSGLLKNQHYFTQTSFPTLDGQTLRTDVIIHLPDQKHLVIDSKVSLNAYQNAVNATEPELQHTWIKQHVQDVRKHIDGLAQKKYGDLEQLNSPGFVIMFMPIEAAYVEALKHSDGLFEYAYNKGVVLVSNTTLLPTLRVVSYLWIMARSNQQAMQIGDQALDIFNQVVLVAEGLAKIGGSMSTMANQYNKTLASFSGRRGLLSKVEAFKSLSTKSVKSVPVLEPIHLGLEQERLASFSTLTAANSSSPAPSDTETDDPDTSDSDRTAPDSSVVT